MFINLEQLSKAERQQLVRDARGEWIDRILVVHGSTRIEGHGYEFEGEPRFYTLFFEDKEVYGSAILDDVLDSDNYAHMPINEDELDNIKENRLAIYIRWSKE